MRSVFYYIIIVTAQPDPSRGNRVKHFPSRYTRFRSTWRRPLYYCMLHRTIFCLTQPQRSPGTHWCSGKSWRYEVLSTRIPESLLAFGCILKTSAPHKSAEQSTSLSGNTVQYDNNTTMMAKNQLDCFFDGLIDPTFGINDSFNLAKCKRASKSPARADDNTRRRTGARRGRQTPSNSSAKAGAHDTGSYMYMEQVKTKQHDGSAASKKACDDS